MEGRRYRELIWGRKELQVLWREGIPIMQRGVREKKTEGENSMQGIAQENFSSKPLMGERRTADYHKFF